MIRIRINVSGDRWCNRDQVLEEIAKSQDTDDLIFEINTEGPSLNALGITQSISTAAAMIGIPLDRIWIDQWHNPVEEVPFKRVLNPRISHFFWMSDNYRHTQVPVDPAPKIFGLFVGRATAPRAVIMHDLWHKNRDDAMFSLMHGHMANWNMRPEILDWVDTEQLAAISAWFSDPPVGSITGHSVGDQYIGDRDINMDLVRYYGSFCVEVVCETYCHGVTFFPTEKTVRPLALGKALLIYGPQHFLKRLQALGFRTWADIWDESYDDLAGPARWASMRCVIDDIMKSGLWSDPRLQLIADHNQDCLDDVIKRYRPT